ncbi:hypothetical protein F53441_1159 [Fusarium austroafricanum]|uniref:Uncharacterized protein n=1 Tax=Fusarium austroafricanum TaxID=2364996 RepID=A0A8H4KWW4_9HYPO|nr:hypothetical protein F53441_1159 [Fusarium austroafricanum]
MAAPIRTIVGNDTTSAEALEYSNQFPITFHNIRGYYKDQIKQQQSYKDLSEIAQEHEIHHLQYDNLNDIIYVKFALFGCEAFRAAADGLEAGESKNVARREAKKLQDLIYKIKKEEKEKKKLLDGSERAAVEALKRNVAWMAAILTLWKELDPWKLTAARGGEATEAEAEEEVEVEEGGG